MLTDKDKAKAILDDRDTTISVISEETGINRVTISNYRNGKTKGVGAMKYDNVVALAKLYDDLQIQYINAKNKNDFYKFTFIIGEWISDCIDVADIADAEMAQEMNDIITADQGIMLRLYKTYNKTKEIKRNSVRSIEDYNFRIYDRGLQAYPGQFILVTPTDATGLEDYPDRWLEVIGNNVAEYDDDVIKYNDDIVKKIREQNEFGL